MKKIVFVLPSLSGGGAERVMSQIAEKLNNKKNKIFFLIFDSSNQVYLNKTRIKIIDLKKKKISSGVLNFIIAIKKIEPDIIISSISHLNLLIALIRFALPKRIKLIFRESNFISNTLDFQKRALFMRIIYKLFYNNCDRCLVFSKKHEIDLLKNTNINRNKIIQVPNPLDISIIRNHAKKQIPKRYTKYFRKKNKNFIIVGSLSYQKGIDIILKSLKFCKKNIFLNIIGQGSEYTKLKRIIKQDKINSKVNIIPFQKNPHCFIKNSDYLILSSRFEGMSNVVLETLCINKPIIYFDNPGASTDILKNTNNFLLKSSNKKYIANILDNIKIKKTKSNSMLTKKFEISKIIKKYEKIINDLF